MAELREYFETDFPRHAHIDGKVPVRSKDGLESFLVTVRVHFDFEASAQYVSAYLSDEVDVISVTEALLQDIQALIEATVGPAVVEMGFSNLPMYANSKELTFCGRLFVYAHNEPAEYEWNSYLKKCQTRGFFPVLRGKAYVREKNRIERPKAFICHDSRDKEDVALKIAEGLQKRLCPVWYDDFSLNVGDSLRESIETGIRKAGACILVLSPNFLSNNGWTKSEFDSIYTREILDKKLLFMPVWHNVGVREVFEYSPKLADRNAVNTNIGMNEVITNLHKAIIAKE